MNLLEWMKERITIINISNPMNSLTLLISWTRDPWAVMELDMRACSRTKDWEHSLIWNSGLKMSWSWRWGLTLVPKRQTKLTDLHDMMFSHLNDTDASDNCAINIWAVASDITLEGTGVKAGIVTAGSVSQSGSGILISSSDSSDFDPRLRVEGSRTSYFFGKKILTVRKFI